MNTPSRPLDLRDSGGQKSKPTPKKDSGFDKMYAPTQDSKAELKKFNMPEKREAPADLRWLIIVMAVAIVAGTVYWFAYQPKSPADPASVNKAENAKPADQWYAVTQPDPEGGETIIYGQITDIKANPVVLKNVYYNYDELNSPDKKAAPDENGSLRLVKKGKETYGPSGEMFIYQAQILRIEPLKPESKVLQAIQQNEKQ